MERIDVSDLPEPVARAIEAVVQAVRLQLGLGPPKEAYDLPRWDGQVLGTLTREEIYDDLL